MKKTPLHLPRIIGHRGACAYAPENTLTSFHAAADMGAEWVELDVKLSRDGEAIVFHDETLERTTNGAGLVAETDFRTLRELDAGSWFGETFVGLKIPTLEEALEVILQRNMGVNIEIKPCPGRELETAAVALDVASRIWPDDVPPPLLSSFQYVSLEAARDMIYEWPRSGLLSEDIPESWEDMADYLELRALALDGNQTPPEVIEQIVDTGRLVLAYTINDPVVALRLSQLGVDSLITDVPDILFENLETRH